MLQNIDFFDVVIVAFAAALLAAILYFKVVGLGTDNELMAIFLTFAGVITGKKLPQVIPGWQLKK